MTQTSIRQRSIDEWAAGLWAAEQMVEGIPPLSSADPPLDSQDAYAVQLAVVALRRAAGQRVAGKKIGLTSSSMQQMIGVDEPDYGHLFDTMAVVDGGVIARSELIAPRVEPEVAFVLGSSLPGWATTPADVVRATAYISPALEIVDSRVSDWAIAWADTVADNGSSARFVLGSQQAPVDAFDLERMGVVLRRNGEVEGEATMNAVLGSPLLSICWLAQKLDDFSITLDQGDVILPGSPCRAPDAARGDYFVADFEGLGSVSVSFA